MSPSLCPSSHVTNRAGGSDLKPQRLLLLTLLGVALALSSCASGATDAERADQALQEGLAAHQAGDLVAAAALYREVLTLDPQNKFAFYNLGLIDQTNDDLSAAENNYRIALSIDADFVAALFNLAIVRESLRAPEEAVDLYRRVLALEPDNAGAHLNLGLLLRSLGQTEEGDAEVQRAREIDPSLGGAVNATPPPPFVTPGPSG